MTLKGKANKLRQTVHKTGKRKVQGVLQSQTAALPRHQQATNLKETKQAALSSNLGDHIGRQKEPFHFVLLKQLKVLFIPMLNNLPVRIFHGVLFHCGSSPDSRFLLQHNQPKTRIRIIKENQTQRMGNDLE